MRASSTSCSMLRMKQSVLAEPACRDRQAVFLLGLARDLARALGDQARCALVANVIPQPAQRDAQAVAQADQEVDVGDAPDPPRDRAAQLDRAEIDHRLALADLRQTAGMVIMERRHLLAAQARLDRCCDI